MGKIDLEDRLINFAVCCIEISEKMTKTFAGNHLCGQLIRSSSSGALNYEEAQSAESKKDFVHKIKVVLKELRETYVNLKIIYRTNTYTEGDQMQWLLKENNELISIIVRSVNTARKNLVSKKESHSYRNFSPLCSLFVIRNSKYFSLLNSLFVILSSKKNYGQPLNLFNG